MTVWLYSYNDLAIDGCNILNIMSACLCSYCMSQSTPISAPWPLPMERASVEGRERRGQTTSLWWSMFWVVLHFNLPSRRHLGHKDHACPMLSAERCTCVFRVWMGAEVGWRLGVGVGVGGVVWRGQECHKPPPIYNIHMLTRSCNFLPFFFFFFFGAEGLEQ